MLQLIMDSLRLLEMHVDGFRCTLAFFVLAAERRTAPPTLEPEPQP